METSTPQSTKSLEERRLELEEKRLNCEYRLKRIEFALKRKELLDKKNDKEHVKSFNISPTATAVIAGVVGLLGTAIGTYYQGSQNLELERNKFTFTQELERQKQTHELVTKMIGTGDRNQAAKNLLFLVEAGFIPDKDGLITKLANSPQNAPVLPFLEGGRQPANPDDQIQIINRIFSPDKSVSDSARDAFIARGQTTDHVLLVLAQWTAENKNNKHGVANALAILATYGPHKGQVKKIVFSRLISTLSDIDDENIRTLLQKFRENFEADQADRPRPHPGVIGNNAAR